MFRIVCMEISSFMSKYITERHTYIKCIYTHMIFEEGLSRNCIMWQSMERTKVRELKGGLS